MSSLFSSSFGDSVRKHSRNALHVTSSIEDGASSWMDGVLQKRISSQKLVQISRWRLLIIAIVIATVFSGLVSRSFYLQVIRGNEYKVLSERNRVYVKRVRAERGVISDVNGNIVATNKPSFSAGIIFSELPDDVEQIKNTIRETLELDDEELQKAFVIAETQPYTETLLKGNLSFDEQLAIKAHGEDLTGVYVYQDLVRDYPYGEIMSQIIGYTGIISENEMETFDMSNYTLRSIVGKTGIENQYEYELQGMLGRAIVEVEANGRQREENIVDLPISGVPIQLTIDIEVQKYLHTLLAESIEEYNSTGGSIVVANPKTGEILAMVSLPTYDNNMFYNQPEIVSEVFNNPRSLLVNRALSGVYSPGSTVKMAIGASALQQGVIEPTTRISGSPQVMRLGEWEFPDWTHSWGRAPHGMMDVSDAIAVSSDIFFYKVGGGFPTECKAYPQTAECQIDGMGANGVVDALLRFGFGQSTGIDLPGELDGLVPDPEWKMAVREEPWYLGNTYHLSIGQGDLLATPVQVLQLTNIVAVDDSTPRMHLIKNQEILDSKTVGELIEKPVDLTHIHKVRSGMIKGTTTGIVYDLYNTKVPVAAKTGTAEFGELNAKGEYQTHAWVTGFAPVENPEISFVVMLEAGGKSSNAAASARKFIDWYYSER